jgi:hypothetical protein
MHVLLHVRVFITSRATLAYHSIAVTIKYFSTGAVQFRRKPMGHGIIPQLYVQRNLPYVIDQLRIERVVDHVDEP